MSESRSILGRHKIFVNTDPQKRCYDGCYFSYRYDWSEWEVLETRVPAFQVEKRLAFWRDLNAYAVSQRGESATREFKDAPIKEVTYERTI
jgi:hypothetical protein